MTTRECRTIDDIRDAHRALLEAAYMMCPAGVFNCNHCADWEDMLETETRIGAKR